MWLLKFELQLINLALIGSRKTKEKKIRIASSKNLPRKPLIRTTLAKILVKNKPPNLSVLVIVGVSFVLMMLWYPSINGLQQQQTSLLAQSSKIERQQIPLKQLLQGLDDIAWLDKYSWLDWQLIEPNAGNKSNQSISIKLQLNGISSYQNWQNLFDQLTEQYHFLPIEVDIKWQINNSIEVDVLLALTMLSSAYPLLPFPKTLAQPWPQKVSLSSAFNWQNQWHARLQLANQSFSLTQGIWLPELAATLVLLDEDGATFRRQHSVRQNHPNEWFVPYVFTAEGMDGVTVNTSVPNEDNLLLTGE